MGVCLTLKDKGVVAFFRQNNFLALKLQDDEVNLVLKMKLLKKIIIK